MFTQGEKKVSASRIYLEINNRVNVKQSKIKAQCIRSHFCYSFNNYTIFHTPKLQMCLKCNIFLGEIYMQNIPIMATLKSTAWNLANFYTHISKVCSSFLYYLLFLFIILTCLQCKLLSFLFNSPCILYCLWGKIMGLLDIVIWYTFLHLKFGLNYSTDIFCMLCVITRSLGAVTN